MKTVSSFIVEGAPFFFEARRRRSPALRYGLAILTVAAGALLSVLHRPVSYQTPYLFFYPAPLFALLFGGRGPAWLAALLGALVADSLQLPPHDTLDVQPAHLLADAYFVLTFGIITWIIDRHRQWAGSEIARQRELLNLANEPIAIRDKVDPGTGAHRTRPDAGLDDASNWVDNGSRTWHVDSLATSVAKAYKPQIW